MGRRARCPGGRSVIPSGRLWEGGSAGVVQVGEHGLPDGGGASAHESVGGLEAGTQECVGLSVKTANSDSRGE